jgi:hypothetical protein
MIVATLLDCGPHGAFYQVTDDDIHLMWVATHAYQQPDGSWLPKTPAGLYTCQRGKHTIPTGESFDTFEVLNVPGHTGILFVHPGNLPERDSDGCFLCGTHLDWINGQQDVAESRVAFNTIFTPHFAGINTFQLTIC